jgi:hypothetical protein
LDVACLLASACEDALTRAAAKFAGPPAGKGTRALASARRLAAAVPRLRAVLARARWHRCPAAMRRAGECKADDRYRSSAGGAGTATS